MVQICSGSTTISLRVPNWNSIRARGSTVRLPVSVLPLTLGTIWLPALGRIVTHALANATLVHLSLWTRELAATALVESHADLLPGLVLDNGGVIASSCRGCAAPG
eukprot:6322143-Amphidinium_carterae.1